MTAQTSALQVQEENRKEKQDLQAKRHNQNTALGLLTEANNGLMLQLACSPYTHQYRMSLSKFSCPHFSKYTYAKWFQILCACSACQIKGSPIYNLHRCLIVSLSNHL